jgi:hypothetical protein
MSAIPQDLLATLIVAGLRLAFLALVFGLYALFLRPVVRAHFFDEPWERFNREARRSRCDFEGSCAKAILLASFSGTFGGLAGQILPNADLVVTSLVLLLAALFVWAACLRWRAIYER